MTYGEVRDLTLKLLNQYTMAGTPVRNSYNCQQDYLNRIPGLVNDAMMEIATLFFHIPATVQLDDLPHKQEGNEIRYELPEDFFQLATGSVMRTRDGRAIHTNQYTLHGRKCLSVPASAAGSYRLIYYRYPRMLGGGPEDGEELDNEPVTHRAIPYYVASQLVAHEDDKLMALWNNKYEDRLERMSPGPTAEVRPVADAYGFFQ